VDPDGAPFHRLLGNTSCGGRLEIQTTISVVQISFTASVELYRDLAESGELVFVRALDSTIGCACGQYPLFFEA